MAFGAFSKLMKIVIETPRLILREFTMEDADLIYQLNKDPQVTKYTGDPVKDVEHGASILRDTIIPQYALYNHGRWAVHTKHDHGVIGWCGLKARPEREEIDLGYRFLQSSWGKGYATEAAYASLRYGFDTLFLPRIVGRAMPANRASIRVLEKCGMRFLTEEIVDQHPALTYEAHYPFIQP
jgi:RimJ/RimL family protein N-acetyltransferase